MLNFLTTKFKIIKRQIYGLIAYCAVYIIAIILGAIFVNKDCNSLLYTNVFNYHLIIVNGEISIFKCFFSCFFVGILGTVVIICFGFSKFTVPLISAIIFYRGLILGSCAILFFTLSKLSGVVLFIILTLPTNAIITAGLIVSSLLNNHANRKGCNNKGELIAINALICLAFTLVAAIYFFLVTAIIVRPINSLF